MPSPSLGPCFPARIFQEIDQSCLVVADLTDEKQNVYCEVGYAKAQGISAFLKFHKETPGSAAAKKSNPANKVHFDLAPYRYIEYDNPPSTLDPQFPPPCPLAWLSRLC
jgi:hypothetical protein